MSKFYLLNDNNKYYIDKIKDGFLVLQDGEQIDLATIKEVFHENDNKNEKDDKISIRQYLLMTEQLGEGNEWEINKWMIYILFSIICFFINFGLCFVGILFSLYTIPLLLIALFCCYQLKKIDKKKMSISMLTLQFMAFLGYPLGTLIFNNYDFLRSFGG